LLRHAVITRLLQDAQKYKADFQEYLAASIDADQSTEINKTTLHLSAPHQK
jgi:hypothetical protein